MEAGVGMRMPFLLLVVLVVGAVWWYRKHRA